jgi:hypothetical protein
MYHYHLTQYTVYMSVVFNSSIVDDRRSRTLVQKRPLLKY